MALSGIEIIRHIIQYNTFLWFLLTVLISAKYREKETEFSTSLTMNRIIKFIRLSLYG
jgi:hypothetical protein